jgi:pimeloyl-ACP methyl ester carboxylesterase
MKADEVRAVGQLGARTFAEAVTHVERVHGAISTRAFKPTSFVGAPARFTHDAVAKVVYAIVRGAGKGVGLAATEVAALVPSTGTSTRTDTDIHTSPATGLAQSILNAAIGDKLAAAGDPLAIPMTIRVDGDPTPALAVFLHGLAEHDKSWGRRYGSQLREEFGFTPAYVRYNTGRHISDNGQALATLLTRLVNEWPVGVERVILVGHSMGGLVARSACHYGAASDEPWTSLVTDVFYLGSPHTGATLERLASKLGWALDRLAETRPYADLVNVRSAGIKDLRYGYIVEEDWDGCDADRCLENHRHEIDFLPHANHYAISASVSGASARLVGDLFVHPASARGRLPIDQIRHLAGLHHFDLLNHPRVYEAMRSWLQHGQPSPAP